MMGHLRCILWSFETTGKIQNVLFNGEICIPLPAVSFQSTGIP